MYIFLRQNNDRMEQWQSCETMKEVLGTGKTWWFLGENKEIHKKGRDMDRKSVMTNVYLFFYHEPNRIGY